MSPKEKQIKSVIHAKDTEITVLSMTGEEDYISLTDIARYASDEPSAVIQNLYCHQRNGYKPQMLSDCA